MEKREFPVSETKLLARPKSAGREMKAFGNIEKIQETTPDSFKDLDFAIFSAGSNQSLDLPNMHAGKVAWLSIIASAFRMERIFH